MIRAATGHSWWQTIKLALFVYLVVYPLALACWALLLFWMVGTAWQ